MKIIEILTGWQVPITNEENEILSKFNESDKLARSTLSQREILLANSLVNKEILSRVNQDGKIVYSKKYRN